MGQSLSCRSAPEDDEFLRAVELGEVERVDSTLENNPTILDHSTIYDRLSPLHVAAANGRVEVLCMILDRSVHPDLLSRNKQTPLMLAAMRGKIACVQRLIQAGANILMFDTLHERTCLHYAAYYGHTDCLEAILSAAQSTSVTSSWGFSRFVNVRDGDGATPLHLAAKQGRPECVHMLLDNGALVCASTGNYGRFPGSTPLHFAARGGSLDCIRELLAWGANRLQRDSSGRIPYVVALRRNHASCAALLNPSAAEPIVWPSPLKFISELNPEAKALLKRALTEANKAREKDVLKEATSFLPSPSHSDGTTEDNDSVDEAQLCCICFDQQCTIEVRNCGHQMCASCTLSLCCHNKPNPETLIVAAPVCPFCRSSIAQLVVAKTKIEDDGTSKMHKPKKSRNLSEGSNSFKGLTSAMGSFGKFGRSPGRILDSSQMIDKP